MCHENMLWIFAQLGKTAGQAGFLDGVSDNSQRTVPTLRFSAGILAIAILLISKKFPVLEFLKDFFLTQFPIGLPSFSYDLCLS